MFEDMKRALEEGKIVAIVDDGKGGIQFGGAFADDRELAETFSSEIPGGVRFPRTILVRGLHRFEPPAGSL